MLGDVSWLPDIRFNFSSVLTGQWLRWEAMIGSQFSAFSAEFWLLLPHCLEEAGVDYEMRRKEGG